jgi:hypothetical protein
VEIFSVNRPETIYVPKVLSVGNPADRIGRNIEPRQESRGFLHLGRARRGHLASSNSAKKRPALVEGASPTRA